MEQTTASDPREKGGLGEEAARLWTQDFVYSPPIGEPMKRGDVDASLALLATTLAVGFGLGWIACSTWRENSSKRIAPV